jgi:hypothetical protein
MMRVVALAVVLSLVGLGTAGQAPLPERDPFPEVERAVRRIDATFFRRARSERMHEQGWAELRAYARDERVYPLLLELFEDRPLTLRTGLLEFFIAEAPADADVLLAWEAVFDEDAEYRGYASAKLIERVGEAEPEHRVQAVIAAGLRSATDREAVSASELVRAFNLLRAVPMLAQAQARPRGSSGGDTRRGAIAQIVVGTQQAFVQDLTPVVATGAVGFQPTIGVATNGTVLRVMDAVVWEFRTEIHRVLVDMTTAASGSATGHLGYDAGAWMDWYRRELEPTLAGKDG